MEGNLLYIKVMLAALKKFRKRLNNTKIPVLAPNWF
jgi:hypothetical protein